ncbi:hypothetical protein HK102_000996, partial [Quaeritorhiza haematococci]
MEALDANLLERRVAHSLGTAGVERIFVPSFSQSPNSSCFHTRPNILSTCTTGRFDFTSSTWLIPADYFTSGDPSEADFTLDSPPTQYTFPPTGGIQLKLTPPPTTGTAKTGSSAKLTSTFYLHYGRFAAQVRAACGTGVVTSFIAYSDDKDEIDLEWTGGPPRAGREILGDLGDIETNVFSKGIIDPTDSHLRFKTIDTGSNTCETTHTYEVLWLPDSIEWFLDGKSIRKYTAQENCNANYTESPNNCRFPVSPSKISFAVWDGGSPENAEGTNEGAGGRTEWTGVGEYVATFDWVEVQCFGDLQSARPTGPPARKEGFSAPSRVDPPAAKVSNVNNNKTQAGAGTDAKGTSNAAETGKGDGDGVGTQQQ